MRRSLFIVCSHKNSICTIYFQQQVSTARENKYKPPHDSSRIKLNPNVFLSNKSRRNEIHMPILGKRGVHHHKLMTIDPLQMRCQLWMRQMSYNEKCVRVSLTRGGCDY